jgi:hypothetical protein
MGDNGGNLDSSALRRMMASYYETTESTFRVADVA